jgi:hypothetical protein
MILKQKLFDQLKTFNVRTKSNLRQEYFWESPKFLRCYSSVQFSSQSSLLLGQRKLCTAVIVAHCSDHALLDAQLLQQQSQGEVLLTEVLFQDSNLISDALADLHQNRARVRNALGLLQLNDHEFFGFGCQVACCPALLKYVSQQDAVGIRFQTVYQGKGKFALVQIFTEAFLSFVLLSL